MAKPSASRFSPTHTFPRPGEANEYYWTYIQQVDNQTPIDEYLEAQKGRVRALLGDLSVEQQLHRYLPDRWTIRELVGHMLDTERVMAYRALRFARGDKTELPGFEHNDYVSPSEANERSILDLLDEFDTIRDASLSLLRGLSDDSLKREGVANGHKQSARATFYIIAGHVDHHLYIIRDRYLGYEK